MNEKTEYQGSDETVLPASEGTYAGTELLSRVDIQHVVTSREEAARHVYETLSKVNVNEHTEKKNGLTYLSWAWAYQIMMEHFPTFTYDLSQPPEEHADGSMTVHAVVGVEHEGVMITRRMWLPVMDYKNQAVKNPSATHINTAKMRCMTKAISMLGLGAYIYAGEDLPHTPEKDEEPKPEKKATPKKPSKPKAVDTSAKEPSTVDKMTVGAEIEDEAGAEEIADLLISLASGMHNHSLKDLAEFWIRNKAVIDVLDREYTEQYERVKHAFTELKQNLKEKTQ